MTLSRKSSTDVFMDSGTSPRRWMEVCGVRVGDQVLDIGGWYQVTHSFLADNGSWCLRFEHGVRYYAEHAPVAIIFHGVDEAR